MRGVDELLHDAQAATSLADFGEESFREGLERLVSAARAEARLSESGRVTLEMQIVALLTSRLQIEHWYRLHPEIEEQEIIAPLIGLGLPRTGSTALSCLLAEDPNARCIRYWESLAPCPPPEAATQSSDPRIAMAEQVVAGFDALYPRLKSMVPGSATAPTECQS
jgi:hypothetical protein